MVKENISQQEVVEKAQEQVEALVIDSRIKVNSKQTLEVSIIQLGNIKEVRKNVKEYKDSVVKPIKEGIKNFTDRLKPIEEKLDIMESYLKSEQIKYSNRLDKEREEREKKAMEEVENGTSIERASKKIDNVKKIEDNISVRIDKVLRITDESKLPREYLIPDERKIIDALKAGIGVSGAELEDKKVIINRY